MKLAVLFSGGKDSCYALHKASQEHKIVCLLSVESENPDSYMFHTPNISLTKLQAEAMDLPLLTIKTKGEKEKELEDLKLLIKKAKEKYAVDGIVSGALASNYQSTRIQKICHEFGLECINPLWHKDTAEYWNELLNDGFEVIVVSTSAEGLNQEWLGKKIDMRALKQLQDLSKKFNFHLAFEGGEAETFVVDCPVFKKKIEIIKAKKIWQNNSGRYIIEKARLIDKPN